VTAKLEPAYLLKRGLKLIVWINGAFGSGKTTCAYELNRRLPKSFVYDPENIGYFIRRNTPEEIHNPDFQDLGQWRLFNYEMLTYLSKTYDGVIIAPMTLNNRRYYDEIIGRLIDDGIVVKHYILYAEKATVEKRLSKRLERSKSWARERIDRCIDAFNSTITEEKIITDHMSINDVVEEIARRCGLILVPDNRNRLKKYIDRITTSLRHIRI
jgi:hypothetical protein